MVCGNIDWHEDYALPSGVQGETKKPKDADLLHNVLAAQDKVNQAVCESLEAVDENFQIIENHVVKLMEASRAHSRQWAVVSFLFFLSIVLNSVCLYLSLTGAKQ